MNKANLSQPWLLRSLITDPIHWDLLMGYVAVEKDRLVIQLLSCTEGELKGIQGQLKALNKLEGLHANLKTEEATRKR